MKDENWQIVSYRLMYVHKYFSFTDIMIAGA